MGMGTERVDHTMVQILAMVVNERQLDWDAELPYVEDAYNNAVSISVGSRAFRSQSLVVPMAAVTKVWIGTSSCAVIFFVIDSSARRTLYGTVTQKPWRKAATPIWRSTPCFENSRRIRLKIGCGCIAMRPPSGGGQRRPRMSTFLN